MPDDNKEPSYERLDETNPEHNRRSFFNWLRGKEETDEEKLRKKLDQELKEAARTRAEQFEEERRNEEQREVAETRKLKKRWREKLFEKSKKLLDEATEKGDEPVNGYEVAKLMVAERIVKLHDMLNDENLDLRRSEIKSLKIHIDFMGLLSEKLDTPELEVPAEIEDLYQTIAASVEETTGEAPPRTLHEQPELAPPSEADVAYNAFAASIVKAIRRSLQSDSPKEPMSAAVADSVAQPVVESKPDTLPLTDQLLSIVQGTALSGEAIRKEITHTDQARHLADVVEKATIIDRYVTHTAASPVNLEQQQPEKEAVHAEKGFELGPNKKIKYMTDVELLSLANTIEIGSGRLLSDVYKNGELDREGLIKVLESYHKGQDYRSELTLRREKFRLHRESSPEYLFQQPMSQTPSPVTISTPEKIAQRAKELGHRMTSLALAPVTRRGRNIGYNLSKKSSTHVNDTTNTSEFTGNLSARIQRQGQVALLLVSVLLVVIVFIVVIQLNSR